MTYSNEKCQQYHRSSTFDDIKNEIDWGQIRNGNGRAYPRAGNCSAESDVKCQFSQEEELNCRMTIRMSAALILTACLCIKACYMIALTVKGRQRKKTQCLTFGDVIVANVLDSDLRIKNECMVNAGEAYRHLTRHTCHKHCKARSISISGDEIGHCQACSKFNQVNKAADLRQPCIATKHKKSLLSNLGSASLNQMIILSLASAAMMAVSIMLAVYFIPAARYFNRYCKTAKDPDLQQCNLGVSNYLKRTFGGFGGFESTATIGMLPPNQASSEMLAFAVSNGAQLLYSLLYLLLVYNFTLISMEYDWGQMEKHRVKPRCTIMRGPMFKQSYLLQLPKRVLYPMMVFSSLMHWLLGQAISTKETVLAFDPLPDALDKRSWESSRYSVGWFLLVSTTSDRDTLTQFLHRLYMELMQYGSQHCWWFPWLVHAGGPSHTPGRALFRRCMDRYGYVVLPQLKLQASPNKESNGVIVSSPVSQSYRYGC